LYGALFGMSLPHRHSVIDSGLYRADANWKAFFETVIKTGDTGFALLLIPGEHEKGLSKVLLRPLLKYNTLGPPLFNSLPGVGAQ
jgi:hypothetical protein